MPRRRRPDTDTTKGTGSGAMPLPGFEHVPATGPPSTRTPVPLAPSPAAALPFRVEIVRSKRRRRTVGAQLAGGVLTVTVPSWMAKAEADQWALTMSRRFARQQTTERLDLAKRAATLARRHDLPRPQSIRWADDMRTRWGSCTPGTGAVRISNRVAAFPDWVVDYVIVHELAHLAVADHSQRFWALVSRFPRTERARGYLIAKSGDVEDE